LSGLVCYNDDVLNTLTGALAKRKQTIEIQKLAYFLERSIEKLRLQNPLDLRFQADKYGPYAPRLSHLLDGLDGSYLHCGKRIADATPFDVIWFEDSKRDKESIKAGLKTWTGGEKSAARKQTLFDDRLVDFALDRLATFN
jgi:uncharacterized protein YwgA